MNQREESNPILHNDKFLTQYGSETAPTAQHHIVPSFPRSLKYETSPSSSGWEVYYIVVFSWQVELRLLLLGILTIFHPYFL